MTAESCFSSREEQLYMLELLVDRVNLPPEKLRQIGTTPLRVRLKFLDFPVFEINQDDFAIASAKYQKEKDQRQSPNATSGLEPKEASIDFGAGKSCLFPKLPRDLVKAMQSQPIEVGIYKKIPPRICGPEEIETPICETKVPLSGCLCDQVAMAMNDETHLPKPYVLKNTYNLIDPEENPCGTLAIFLRLSCFGKSIVTHFALQDKTFLFKNPRSASEFQCTRVPTGEEELTRRKKEARDVICLPAGHVESEVDPAPKPRAVIGLGPVCQTLAERDGGAPEVTASSLPTKTPAERGDCQTKRTTSMTKNEKSDELVYLANPRDPACVCSSDGNFLKRLTGAFPCRGAGCQGSLCVGTRTLDPFPRDFDGGTETSPCYTGSCCSGRRTNGSNCCERYRMRGGGGFSDTERKSSARCTDQVEGLSPFRMGADPIFPRLEANVSAAQSIDTLLSGACKSPLTSKSGHSKPGCCCQGKPGQGERLPRPALGTKNGAACSKSPCLGIDCLIRAFKETQDFVDSIGKVPGLAGLGLMDPSESPYFSRERDQEGGNTCSPRTPVLPISSLPVASPNPPTIAKPRVAQTSSVVMTTPTPVPSHALTTTPTGRDISANIAEVTSLMSGRSRRKEEKPEKQRDQELPHHNQIPSSEAETGPCGETKCKSRRKKRQEDGNTEHTASNALTSTKPANSASSKTSSGVRTSDKSKPHARSRAKHHGTDSPGPGGDRKPSNSYIKVSKRVMKQVYAAGTRYPGTNYGHRNCVDLRMRVPANMGWLWNTREMPGHLKPRLGWKPGAISKYLYDLLNEAKAGSDSVSETRSAGSLKGKKGKVTKTKSYQSLGRGQRAKKKETEEEVELPPTLHIHRKDGTYYVTMYPIKREEEEGRCEDVAQAEAEPVKPLQFKITKNKEEGSICSSSEASDLEIEFSPPAALSRYRKKPCVRHIDTQVKQQEILDALKLPGEKKEGKGNKDKKGKGKK